MQCANKVSYARYKGVGGRLEVRQNDTLRRQTGSWLVGRLLVYMLYLSLVVDRVRACQESAQYDGRARCTTEEREET
jgi:hypothetical protein